MKNIKYLISVIVVVTLLVIFFGGQYFNNKRYSEEKPQLMGTIFEMKKINTALKSFKEQCGRWPTQEEGIGRLNTKQDGCAYIPTSPVELKDKWGNDFVFLVEGENVKVISDGAEKIESSNLDEPKILTVHK